jgi:hypothetical protein
MPTPCHYVPLSSSLAGGEEEEAKGNGAGDVFGGNQELMRLESSKEEARRKNRGK